MTKTMGRVRPALRATVGATLSWSLGVPALALSIATAGACGGASPGLPGGSDGTGPSGGTAPSATSDDSSVGSPSGFTGTASAGTCNPKSLDLVGCSCSGGPRVCYSGPPATRGVGACRSGTQTCMGGEVPVWGPCTKQVLPVRCDAGGTCEPSAACLPPVDASAAPVDSGIPPHCHIVQGYNGNGTLADGSLYCEGQFNPAGNPFGDAGFFGFGAH